MPERPSRNTAREADTPATSSHRAAFLGLFVATVASMLGMGIVVPILPLYAKHLGASGLVVGMILAGFALSRGIFAPIMGNLSDRYGRKQILIAGLMLDSLFSAAYVLTSSPATLLAVRILQGFSSVMVTPVAQAYVGDITPVGREGEYMNLFYISLFGGMAIGPSVGGYLSDAFSLRAPFWGMAAAGLVGLALVVLFVPEEADDPQHASRPRMRLKEAMGQVFGDRKMRGILTYIASRGFYRWGFNTFFPIFAVHTLSISRTKIGLILSGYMLGGGLMQYPTGKLVDRYAAYRTQIIVVGGVTTATLMFVLPSLTSVYWVTATVVLLGLLSAFARAAAIAIRTEQGRTFGMGAVTGAFTTSMSAGQVLGPIAFGLVVDLSGVRASFYLGGIVGLVGALGAWAFLRNADTR